jgi:ribosomal protein L14
VVPVRAYDYDGEERLDPAEVEEVLDVVWRTALPEGLSTVGSIFDAVVVRFPRLAYIYEGDEIDPATAEWIVIVNAGRLE